MNNFIKKFERLIENYISKSSKKSCYSKDIYRSEKYSKIIYSFESKDAQCCLDHQTFYTEYQQYLDGKTDLPVHLRVDSKQLQQFLIKLIIKQQPDDITFDKLVDSLIFSNRKLSFLEIIECATNTKEMVFAKKITLKTLEMMGEQTAAIYVQREEFSKYLKTLSQFDLKQEEYPLVHNFFKFYAKILIKEPHTTEYEIVKFLKAKIKTDNWHEFSVYCPHVKGLAKIDAVEGEYFKENKNEVYNLVINTDFIKYQHPYIATSYDLRVAIKDVLDTFSRMGKSLHVGSAFNSDITDDTACVHFLALDQHSLDKPRINKMFALLIDHYAQRYQADGTVKYDYMNKAFEAAFIDSALEQKDTQHKRMKL